MVSLKGFDNAKRIFPAVHPDTPFSLVTLGPQTDRAELVHYALSVEETADANRRFTLTPDEFRLINPNTRTCPVFRSQRDAELTKKLYRNAPVLIAEIAPEDGSNPNPWGISFQRMLDMSNDSALFLDAPAAPGAPPCLPLYEAKMIHQFDHRWATYVDAPDKPDGLDTKDVSEAQKADPAFTVRPRYWVEEAEVLSRIARVPSRVANAWLVWRKTHATAQAQASQALTQALAGWVAGELFCRAAGPATEANGWKSTIAWNATQTTEAQLRQHHPTLAKALAELGTTGKKALPAFTKWALQDDPAQGLGLVEAELEELMALQALHQAAGENPNSVAHPAHPTRSTGQFGINFSWLDAWMDRRSPRWLMGWRDITNATNERTVIATVFGRAGVGNKIPLIFPGASISAAMSAALLGNLSALVLDYVARQKIGGTTLNYFYLKQFPILPPNRYTASDLAYIVPRVLELTHTAQDMQPWADDLAAYDPRAADQRQMPFPWNPERRAQLRAELDAYYARLYGLTRDELCYILDPGDIMGADYPSETFRVLKNNEMRTFGEYRAQRLVLAAWDALERESH